MPCLRTLRTSPLNITLKENCSVQNWDLGELEFVPWMKWGREAGGGARLLGMTLARPWEALLRSQPTTGAVLRGWICRLQKSFPPTLYPQFLHQWPCSPVAASSLSSGESGQAVAGSQSVGMLRTGWRLGGGHGIGKGKVGHLLSYTSMFFLAGLPETMVVFPLFSRKPAQNSFSRLSSSGMGLLPEITEAVPLLFLLLKSNYLIFPFPPVSALQASLFLSACVCSTISHWAGKGLEGKQEACFEGPHQDLLGLECSLGLGDVKESGLHGTLFWEGRHCCL